MTNTAKKLTHAYLTDKYLLNKPGSSKKTYHITLDIGQETLDFESGDSVAIYPENPQEVVIKTIQTLKTTPSTIIFEKRTQQTSTVQDFISKRANITKIPISIIRLLEERHIHLKKREFLIHLLKAENRAELTEYLHNHELWDLLQEHEESIFTAQEIADLLLPMIPRFYSIASSPKMNKKKIDLTVAYVSYSTSGHIRTGIGSHFLCEHAKKNQTPIPLYVQPSHGFTLPTDSNTPIIMVGPGTGIAPFKAFLEERMISHAEGKNWLFFGERNGKTDFYYEDFFKDLQKKGFLDLDTAFSRDQEQKIYVQDRMCEKSEKLFYWIENGAHFYVCGDAKKMAKDVDNTLLHIIKKHGKLGEEESKAYLKNLRKEKRYLTDVY